MDSSSHKRPRRPINAIDGFVGPKTSARSSSGTGAPRSRIGVDTHGRLSERSRLDVFHTGDGFHPAKQPTIEPTTIEGRHIGRNPHRDDDGKIDLSLPPATTDKPHKKHKWRKILKRTALGFTVTLLLVTGLLFGKGYLKLRQIFKGGGGAAALQDDVDPSKLRGEGDGRVNILLLGIGGEGHEGPDLSDTILVASIDPVQKTAALLSIPRDLWVDPEGFGAMKINSIYANNKYAALAKKVNEKDAIEAGLSAVDKEVEKDMGIPIHYHALIDARGFEQAIDTVGGVDVNVDAKNTVHEVLWDDIAHKTYVLDVKQGLQHFDGQRATFYARSRHTSPRGDFDRTERQRLLMLALKSKVLSLGTLSNPAKISQLISDFGDHIQTNMSLSELHRLYDIGKNINDIASLGLADPPNNFVTTDNVNGISIVRPRAGLDDFSQIQNYVRNALRDGFIANENAKIIILNGTSLEGLATRKSTELKSFGYNVTQVADAPTKNYDHTILVDLRSNSKKYTRHYLEQRLGVTAITTLPDSKINAGDADFVIIVGQNESTVH